MNGSLVSCKYKGRLSLDVTRNKLCIKFHNENETSDPPINNDGLYVKLQISGYSLPINKSALCYVTDTINPHTIQLGTINNSNNEYVSDINIKTLHSEYGRTTLIIKMHGDNYLLFDHDSFQINI